MADPGGIRDPRVTPYAVHLAWDTSHFGFGVARVSPTASTPELAAGLAALRQAGYRLAYWSVPAGHDELIAAGIYHGGFLADEKLTYVKSLGVTPLARFPYCHVIEPYTAACPDDALVRLAIGSAAFSRFRRDQSFPPEVCDKLYKLWIERSVSGEIADEVLVVREGGTLLGMITLVHVYDRGDIGLVAVDAVAQGRGIGRLLVTEAGRRFGNAGRRAVQVVTQGQNQRACRLYESCGYSIERREIVFHFWF